MYSAGSKNQFWIWTDINSIPVQFTRGRMSMFNSIKCPRLFICSFSWCTFHSIMLPVFYFSTCLYVFPFSHVFRAVYHHLSIISSLLQTSVSPSEYNTHFFIFPPFHLLQALTNPAWPLTPTVQSFSSVHIQYNKPWCYLATVLIA